MINSRSADTIQVMAVLIDNHKLIVAKQLMTEKSDILRMLMDLRSVRYPKCRLITLGYWNIAWMK